MLALALLLTADNAPLRAQQPALIDAAELPRPPAAIRALIAESKVQFEAGPRRPNAESSRIVAETQYQIAFNYNCQSSWKLTAGGRRLVINVRYTRLGWSPTHRVWFLQRPAADDFWSNRLVLHELDHVRISSDRRFAKRFGQRLREQPVLKRKVDHGEIVNRELIDRLVDQHVAAVFAEISDLIAIRYQELDRLTGHGQRPIPVDSELNRWLGDDDAKDQPQATVVESP